MSESVQNRVFVVGNRVKGACLVICGRELDLVDWRRVQEILVVVAQDDYEVAAARLVERGYDARVEPFVEGCWHCKSAGPMSPMHEPPSRGDDAAWARVAEQHRPGCEWVANRAWGPL